MKIEVEIPDPEIEDILENMEERELLSLLLNAFDRRKPPKSSAWKLRLCIEDEGCIYLVADGGTNWVRDAHLSQFGECCVPIVSWAKNAICPICGKEVHLT